MNGVNECTLMGNVTRDPELRHTPAGKAVCNVGMAMNRRVPDGQGGYTERVTFLDVTFWEKQAETLARCLHKGDAFFCRGEISQEDRIINAGKDNERKERKTIITGRDFRFLPNGRRHDESAPPRGGKHDPAPVPGAPLDAEDEIPF